MKLLSNFNVKPFYSHEKIPDHASCIGYHRYAFGAGALTGTPS